MDLLKLSRVAQDYYESLKSNIVNGWEKNVVTDGVNCMFVSSTYEPKPGEAMFYLVVRSRSVMCQLKAFNDNNLGRYAITPSDKMEWVIKDNETGIQVTFLEGMYKERHDVYLPESIDGTILGQYRKWLDAIEQWVKTTHATLYSCNVAARKSAIGKLGKEWYWLALADALNGINILPPNGEYGDLLNAEALEYVSHGDSPFVVESERDQFLKDVGSLTDSESHEVCLVVEAFWSGGRSTATWSRDILWWPTFADKKWTFGRPVFQ